MPAKLVAVLLGVAAISTAVGCGDGVLAVGHGQDAASAVAVTPATIATRVAEPVWITTVPRMTTPATGVTVTGQGFEPGETVDARLIDGAGQQIIGPLAQKADVRGSLPGIALQLPAETTPGAYSITVQGEASGRQATVVLWVQAGAPELQLDREAAQPEATVTITATGFAPRERVVVYFEGHGAEPITALSADGSGKLLALNVAVPLLPPGDLQLIATGSESLAHASHAFRILPFEPVVMLNANIVPPGEAVSLYGYGFAARDQMDIALENGDGLPLTLHSDDRGQLRAAQAFSLPPNLNGQQAIIIHTQLTGREIRAPFQVVASFPLIELDSYLLQPGSKVGLAVRYLRPRERLDVYLGEGSRRKKIASFRADERGWLLADSSFNIPQDASPGPASIAFEGEAARPPMSLKIAIAQ